MQKKEKISEHGTAISCKLCSKAATTVALSALENDGNSFGLCNINTDSRQ